MTMLVGMNLGAYVLIASDRRESYILNGKVVKIITDDADKLIEWNGGYITGSGLVSLLVAVKSNCANTDISSTDDLVQMAKDEALKFLNRTDVSNIDKEYWQKNTGWMFTYSTELNGNATPRLAHMRPENNYKVAVLPRGKATIWAKGKDVEKIMLDLEEDMVLFDGDPFQEEYIFKESLRINQVLIQTAFKKVSEFDESVCENFNLGIQLSDGNKSKLYFD